VIVLILTFVSTAFTGIQTVKAFLPSSPPASTEQTPAAASHTSSTSRTASLAPTTTFLTKSSAGSLTLLTSTHFFSGTASATPSLSPISSGLRGSAIAGIVVGVILALISLSGVLFLFLRRKRSIVRKERSLHRTYDAENTVMPSYAFSPSSDIFNPPRRQFTEFSGSTDASAAEEIRAQYVRTAVGSELDGPLPRTLTVTL
jgi:hypothetical protein